MNYLTIPQPKNIGGKKTRERQLILEKIKSSAEHFDAESLYEALKKQGQKISRATIYRSIQLLLKSGIIKEAVGGLRKTYYEFNAGHKHHDHLICLGCGEIIEFYNKKIEALQQNVCKKNHFRPCEHIMIIRGYCKQCKVKLKNQL